MSSLRIVLKLSQDWQHDKETGCLQNVTCFRFNNCLSHFPLLQDGENNKLAPLPIFTAADIIQVVPSHAAPLGLQYRDVKSGKFKLTL